MLGRLKEIRDCHKLNQADFAKSLGMGQSTLAMLEVGKREILDRHIKTVCSIYDVNEAWFRTGEGEMFAQPETFSLDEKAQKNNLTELEIDIMKGYMDLPSATRGDLMALFGSIYSKHTETAAAVVDPIEAQLASIRRELEDEQKGATLSASNALKGKSM